MLLSTPPLAGSVDKKEKPAAARGRAGRQAAGIQRAETYIVISKPKRKSVAVGVVHCISVSWSGSRAAGGGRGGNVGSHRWMFVPGSVAGNRGPLQSGLMIFMIRCRCGEPAPRLATMPVVHAAPSYLHAIDAEQPPLRRLSLAVGDGHLLHVEEWGAADGLPALVLHGGPGSGCSPLQRRFFDPARFRIICPDQRGAGRSLPACETRTNTTAHLLADLKLLRDTLGIDRWLVVGGSWGATLALAHALDAPDAVSGLLLRGSFLARPQDIDGFFADAPESLATRWRRLARLPLADDEATSIADAWARHEQRLSGGGQPMELPDIARLLPRYRIQSHYLQHGCWLQAPPLLDRCGALPPVPMLLLHGAEDRICPTDGAVALAQCLPQAGLRWAEGAGHDPAHPAMAALMVQALECYAECGHFGAVEVADR